MSASILACDQKQRTLGNGPRHFAFWSWTSLRNEHVFLDSVVLAAVAQNVRSTVGSIEGAHLSIRQLKGSINWQCNEFKVLFGGTVKWVAHICSFASR